MKRSMRSGVEDRWHRPPRPGETPPEPLDAAGPGCWCVDKKHGERHTLVTTNRHGKGMRWQARWVDNGGNERSKSFERKADAQTQLTGITGQIATGTYADPVKSAETFGSVAEDWLASKATLKPKTYAGYGALLETLILPKWKRVRLRDIDHAGLQTWVTGLSTDGARQRGKGGLSASRVIQAHQVVRQVFGYAIRAKLLAVNPAVDMQLPRKVTPEKIALTHEQVATLTANAGEVSALAYTLAYTGLRFGEAAALRVSDFDPDKHRLRVSRSVTYVQAKGWTEGTTKTHQGRSVPLPKTVVDKLTAAVEGRDCDAHLFPGADGGMMTTGWFRVRFDPAVAKLDVEGVTPHTLRHTAGSLALASGASIATVQKLLGHRNATTTLNVYAHMLPDDFDNLAAAMDKAATDAAKD